MSYRDLRNFNELLRTLGCPIVVSLESFRNPNFPLLSELLLWLSKRLDPDADLPEGPYYTEQDRVLLIRSTAQFLVMKANLKLNTRRLYGADGHAVRELLKVATLLFDALHATSNDGDKENDESISNQFDLNNKVNELKKTRQLASDITANGAILHELLGKEVDLQSQRQMSVARQVEIGTIEDGIKNAIEDLKKDGERTKKLTDNIALTEANLDQRIERKRNELERSRNRLQTLQKVRPAFLDEYSALEKELQVLYNEYVSRYRTMIYLESLVEEQERAETSRAETQQEAARKLAEQMRLEEDTEEMTDIPEEDIIPSVSIKTMEVDRLRIQTGVRAPPGTRTDSRLYGAMNADSANSESSLTTSETDSEDILLNDEDLDQLGDIGVAVPRGRSSRTLESRLNKGEGDAEIIAAMARPNMSAIRNPSARILSSRARPLREEDDDF